MRLMMSKLWFFIPGIILAVFAGCGGGDPTPTPVPTAVVIQTEGLTPTATPLPPPPVYTCIGGQQILLASGDVECRPIPPSPEIVVVIATPEPESAAREPEASHPTLEPLEPASTPLPTEPPPPTPTASAPPTPPGPTPKPTSRYRPVGAPEDLGFEGFVFTGGPQANSLDITFSASIEANRYTEPTEIQVWQALRRDDTDGECSTERPIAFIAKPRGGTIYIPASTTYSWSYCTVLGQEPTLYSQKIPWLAAEAWTYNERSRSKNYDPYVTDIAIHINLRDDRVDDLRYSSSDGYILLIFNDDQLLSKVWVEGN